MFLIPLIRDNRILVVSILLILCSSLSLCAQSMTGVIRAQEEVIVRSEYSGLVEHIAVHEGDAVIQGQLLVELRNTRQKINVQLAQAGLTKAEAALKETQVVLDAAEKDLNRTQIAGSALPRKEV